MPYVVGRTLNDSNQWDAEKEVSSDWIDENGSINLEARVSIDGTTLLSRLPGDAEISQTILPDYVDQLDIPNSPNEDLVILDINSGIATGKGINSFLFGNNISQDSGGGGGDDKLIISGNLEQLDTSRNGSNQKSGSNNFFGGVGLDRLVFGDARSDDFTVAGSQIEGALTLFYKDGDYFQMYLHSVEVIEFLDQTIFLSDYWYDNSKNIGLLPDEAGPNIIWRGSNSHWQVSDRDGYLIPFEQLVEIDKIQDHPGIPWWWHNVAPSNSIIDGSDEFNVARYDFSNKNESIFQSVLSEYGYLSVRTGFEVSNEVDLDNEYGIDLLLARVEGYSIETGDGDDQIEILLSSDHRSAIDFEHIELRLGGGNDTVKIDGIELVDNATTGSSFIDGGSGIDTVVVAGVSSNFELYSSDLSDRNRWEIRAKSTPLRNRRLSSLESDEMFPSNLRFGEEKAIPGFSLFNVEFVQFDDQIFDLQTAGIGNSGDDTTESGTIGSITSSVTGIFREGVTLTAPAVTGDPDGDATNPNYSYQWYKGGNIVAGATASTYTVPASGAGTYKVAITYTDAQGFIATVDSPDQVISVFNNGNGTPGAIKGNGVLREGVTLTAPVITGDPDGMPTKPNYKYQWFRNNSAISRATGKTYKVPTTGSGTYRVAVTYTDAQGFTATVNSANQAVAKFNNGNGTPGAIKGNGVLREGVTLTAPVITGDPDGMPTKPNYKYQWFRNNSAISRATGKTYKVPATGSGNYKVGITYADAQKYTATVNSRNLFIAKVIFGTAKADTLRGTIGDDLITGLGGADRLTGGAGKDTFRYNSLSDSRLAAYDRITDFAIGTDRIDAPRAVTARNLRQLGRVSALTQDGIGAVLTRTTFRANRAATFTLGTGERTRTFLALNDNRAGFSSAGDGLIEITGFKGSLANLAII
jgi:Ca2+-binding RTX toxin-like protein